jgi:hypothetical protein
MKKREKKAPAETSMARYDLSKASRGRYAGRFKAGDPIVAIDDEVWSAFPGARLINDALRVLASAVVRARPKKAAVRRAKRAA